MSLPTRCPLCHGHDTTVVEAGEYDADVGCLIGRLDCYGCGEVEVYYLQHPEAIEIVDARPIERI